MTFDRTKADERAKLIQKMREKRKQGLDTTKETQELSKDKGDHAQELRGVRRVKNKI